MMTAAWLLVVALGVLLLAVGQDVLKKMLSEELRTRIDSLPKLFLALALHRLTPEVREYWKADWESNLLLPLNAASEGKPVTRFAKSFWFGLSLWLSSGRILKETKTSNDSSRAGKAASKQRILSARTIRAPGLARARVFTYWLNGDIRHEIHGPNGLIDYVREPNGDLLFGIAQADGSTKRVRIRKSSLMRPRC